MWPFDNWFKSPEAATMQDGRESRRGPIHASGGAIIATQEHLEELMRAGAFGSGFETMSGLVVTPDLAMKVAAVFASVRIISGGYANLPMVVTTEDADGNKTLAPSRSPMVRLLKKRPCSFMRAWNWRRMGTMHVLLRGNFYALKVRGVNGHVLELIPLHPDRVEVEQLKDLSLVFHYIRPTDGKRITYKADEILHLYNMTFDGVNGVTPLKYAREVIGGQLSMSQHQARVLKHGARVAGVFSTDKKLGDEGRDRLRAGIEEYRQSGVSEGRDLVLEDGLTYNRMGMTNEDLEFIEMKKLSATEIFMMFGIPPHMASVVDKTTSWGTGIEEQNKGFLAYTLNDYVQMWEEGINCDVIHPESNMSVAHDLKTLTRGTAKDRADFYSKMLQSRVYNPNEVRKEEGMNPYPGGEEFLPTPTMSATAPGEGKQEGDEE